MTSNSHSREMKEKGTKNQTWLNAYTQVVLSNGTLYVVDHHNHGVPLTLPEWQALKAWAETNFEPKSDLVPAPEMTFEEWYDANHHKLHLAYVQQEYDPPFKDVFLFAQAAWTAALDAKQVTSADPADREAAEKVEELFGKKPTHE